MANTKLARSMVLLATAATLIAIAACNKGNPTNPTPVVQSIIVNSSSDMLFIGTSETFTATATASDGSSIAVVGGVWGSDSPSVATVDASGRVTIEGSGMATIFVDYQGRRGSKLIRGLPNYQGAWSGSYYITSCSNSGDFASAKFCRLYPANTMLSTKLNLTQDRDRVEGHFYLGKLSGEASGPIQTDGTLLLEGSIKQPPATIDVSWRLQSATPGRITGSLKETWIVLGYSGYGVLNCRIQYLDRTSTMMMAPGPGGLWMMNPTLEDLFRAIIQP
jgi:hypothetical protein